MSLLSLLPGILSQQASAPPAASAVTFVGSASGGLANNDASDMTLTLPSFSTDDFAIIYFYYDLGSGNANTLTTPSGWTLLTGWPVETLGGRSMDTSVLYRKLVSGDANPTLADSASGGRSACLVVFRGVDTTTPFDATATKNENQNDTTPTPTAITTATSNAAVVLLVAATHNNMSAFAPPSGYTLGPSHINLFRNSAIAYDLDVGAAGAETPGDWTLTGGSGVEESHTVTIALRPA